MQSTYCKTMQQHGENVKRSIHVVNLDPAAEVFQYQPVADVRELISVDDAMEDDELHFGPNGGLIFCMEFLLENLNWLEEAIGDQDDDYILFDCPGQIELYTHLNVMRRLVDALQAWNFRVCAVFLLDSHFMIDSASFISGAMAALSAMVCLEVPHVNVLSKIDLLSKSSKKQLERFLEPDARDLCSDESPQANPTWRAKHGRLTAAIGRVLEDYSLVKFSPLHIGDEESVSDLLFTIDNCVQFAEDQEVRVRDFDPPEEDDVDDGYGESSEPFNAWSREQGID